MSMSQVYASFTSDRPLALWLVGNASRKIVTSAIDPVHVIDSPRWSAPPK